MFKQKQKRIVILVGLLFAGMLFFGSKKAEAATSTVRLITSILTPAGVHLGTYDDFSNYRVDDICREAGYFAAVSPASYACATSGSYQSKHNGNWMAVQTASWGLIGYTSGAEGEGGEPIYGWSPYSGGGWCELYGVDWVDCLQTDCNTVTERFSTRTKVPGGVNLGTYDDFRNQNVTAVCQWGGYLGAASPTSYRCADSSSPSNRSMHNGGWLDIVTPYWGVTIPGDADSGTPDTYGWVGPYFGEGWCDIFGVDWVDCEKAAVCDNGCAASTTCMGSSCYDAQGNLVNGTKVCITEPSPVDGVCGSSRGGTFTVSTDITNKCLEGDPTSVSGTGPWTWSCVGRNGGATNSPDGLPCVAYKTGTCGSANGQAFFDSAPPTNNLCQNPADASVVSGGGPWTWTCNSTPCSAYKKCERCSTSVSYAWGTFETDVAGATSCTTQGPRAGTSPVYDLACPSGTVTPATAHNCPAVAADNFGNTGYGFAGYCEAPKDFASSCSADGRTLSLNWTAHGVNFFSPNRYYLRVDSNENAQTPGTPPYPNATANQDSYIDDQTGTSFSRPTNPGFTYTSWMHLYGPLGYSPGASKSTTCPTPTPTCTGFNYGAWSVCSGGVQTRSVISTIPATCSGGVSPITSQACSTPCTSFNYGAWSVCSGGVQTRSVISSVPASCTGGVSPVTAQACTDYCTGFNYGAWSVCSGGLQTRSVISTIPAVCSGGVSPITSQACSTPCTGFNYDAWGVCSGGVQTRNVLSSVPATCTGGVSPVTAQACTDSCTGFNYSAWGACSGGLQTRSVISTIPATCTGGVAPVTSQGCCSATFSNYSCNKADSLDCSVAINCEKTNNITASCTAINSCTGATDSRPLSECSSCESSTVQCPVCTTTGDNGWHEIAPE